MEKLIKQHNLKTRKLNDEENLELTRDMIMCISKELLSGQPSFLENMKNID